MNISGVLVVAKPERLAEVTEALAALAGIEVHQVDEVTGRIIVIQEAADIHAEIDGVKRIKAMPHVVMADMVYHYIADDDNNYEEIPPELVEQDQACSVPAYLHD